MKSQFNPPSVLLEEVKANKANLKKCIGRKLAFPLLRKYTEDFVDEYNGEVISLHRNESIYKRGHVITKQDADLIHLYKFKLITLLTN